MYCMRSRISSGLLSFFLLQVGRVVGALFLSSRAFAPYLLSVAASTLPVFLLSVETSDFGCSHIADGDGELECLCDLRHGQGSTRIV